MLINTQFLMLHGHTKPSFELDAKDRTKDKMCVRKKKPKNAKQQT